MRRRSADGPAFRFRSKAMLDLTVVRRSPSLARRCRHRGAWGPRPRSWGEIAPRGGPGHRLPLVALMPQWRQSYPNKRPPTWATAISDMGQNPPPATQKIAGLCGARRHKINQRRGSLPGREIPSIDNPCPGRECPSLRSRPRPCPRPRTMDGSRDFRRHGETAERSIRRDGQPRALAGSSFVGYGRNLDGHGPQPRAAAIAVGIAILAMHMTDGFHPPAEINPLLIVLYDRSWSFLVVPVGAGLIMLGLRHTNSASIAMQHGSSAGKQCPFERRLNRVEDARLSSLFGSCPSGRGFAPHFLQTPPRRRRPCASLTLRHRQAG